MRSKDKHTINRKTYDNHFQINVKTERIKNYCYDNNKN